MILDNSGDDDQFAKTYISKRETCIRLQACSTLKSRRRSMCNAVKDVANESLCQFSSLTKDHYISRRVPWSEYKAGKLFRTKLFTPKDGKLKITISQFGNLKMSSETNSRLQGEKVALHVSLRRGNSVIAKQKVDIIQNPALRVFKYIYVVQFNGIMESDLRDSFLKFKLKTKRAMFRAPGTLAQQEVNLCYIRPTIETALEVLFV